MNKAQELLFESVGTYGIMKDKPCRLKFDKNGNPDIDIPSLYPSLSIDIDKSRIVDAYKTKEGWVIEI